MRNKCLIYFTFSIQFRYGTVWGPIRGETGGNVIEAYFSENEYADHIIEHTGWLLALLDIGTNQRIFGTFHAGSYSPIVNHTDRSVLLYMKGEYCPDYESTAAGICNATFTFLL